MTSYRGFARKGKLGIETHLYVPTTYADTTAVERDFGFTPKITFREGLRKIVEWYAGYYLAGKKLSSLNNRLRMASSQTPFRKALEFCARTVASGMNGGGRMASARKMEDYGGAPEEESAILRIYRNSDLS